MSSPDIQTLRIGLGYDIHRLVPGRKLMLGGMEVPYQRGSDGHSDADVLLHAVMDALLGAAALGDIGTHFPNTDERYRGISSMLLLDRVRDLVTRNGYDVRNVDATVILEAPKIAPFIDGMRTNIAAAIGIPIADVSVKATTAEGLGPVGTGDGVAAHAVVSLVRR